MPRTADSHSLRNLAVIPRRDLCLDYANTLGWRGSETLETLHNLAEVLAWLAANGAMPELSAAELGRWFEGHTAQAASVFADAIDLRETIYRLLRSLASKSAPARDDLRRLNLALASAPARTILGHHGDRYVWRIETQPAAAAILAPVLWSAADLLVGGNAERVRQCANDRCLWLFLDESKNGTRRWCSMQSCGNRAKARRHYLRQKRG